MRRILLVLAAALVLAGCGAAPGTAGQAGSPDSRYVPADGKTIMYPPAQRKDAPAVHGSTVDGKSADLAGLKGRVVVLNFWASWCPPCRLEATDLESVYKSTKDTGVTFLGVNSRDEKDSAKSFEDARLTYPSLFDPNGRVALAFADVPPVALPCTLIIDRAGKVAVVIRAPVRQDTLAPMVAQIAAEKV
jgi:peroxiredoxin